MGRDSGMDRTRAGRAGAWSAESEGRRWRALLLELDPGELHEGGALEAITSLERLKRAASAAQARLSVRVDEVARGRQRREALPSSKLGMEWRCRSRWRG